MKWALGRIVIKYPGKDRKVRVVALKTSKGTFQKNVTLISPFPKDVHS